VFELRVRVDVPVPPELTTILVGDKEAVRPAGDAEVERPTVPVKPFTLETVIVVVLASPVTTVRLDGAEIAKSVTVTVTLTEWESDPLVPRTVTV